jgi:hypothetical protein
MGKGHGVIVYVHCLYRSYGLLCKIMYLNFSKIFMGRCSSVSIGTGYGLDGTGIEYRWGRDFPNLSTLSLGPTQPPVPWVPGLSRGKERSGRDVDPSPPSSAIGHERVELYLYSPYGPYGLYKGTLYLLFT